MDVDRLRERLGDDHDDSGPAACRRRSERVDTALRELCAETFGENSDWALIALGGYGRASLAPQSDIDVMLASRRPVDPDLVRALWYPLWDAGAKLGHSVRTINEFSDIVSRDLATATAGLSARHIAGDPKITSDILRQAEGNWISDRHRWMNDLAESVADRHRSAPDVAWALEPDLKEGRGGLRDLHAIAWGLDWFRLTGNTPPALDGDALASMEDQLTSIRVALHRVRGRSDLLVFQDQDAIAEELGELSVVDLLTKISRIGRAIGRASDDFWFDVSRTPPAIRPEPDAVSVLAAATSAVRLGRRFDRDTLEMISTVAPPDAPWTPALRESFVDFLAAGPGLAAMVDVLDGAGFWSILIPEWINVASRPQRNAYHRFTVDRHLIETVIHGAALTGATDRPDLLLLACLVHDLGKIGVGDHTVIGMELAGTIGARSGLNVADIETLRLLVEHHLLLADVATRRDLDDPVIITAVAEKLTTETNVELLRCLTIADSAATGPAAWSAWKASLVDTLAERTIDVIRGGTATRPDRDTSPEILEIQSAVSVDGIARWIIDEQSITIVAPDRPGLLARLAGTLSLSGAMVLEVAATTDQSLATDRFVLDWDVGGAQWGRLTANLELAMTSRLALTARLAERARSYRASTIRPSLFPPDVRILNTDSDRHTVIEASGPDSIGLLSRLARALAELDLDIHQARVTTMGEDVVDSFYVQHCGGQVVDPDLHGEIRRALLHALAPPA